MRSARVPRGTRLRLTFSSVRLSSPWPRFLTLTLPVHVLMVTVAHFISFVLHLLTTPLSWRRGEEMVSSHRLILAAFSFTRFHLQPFAFSPSISIGLCQKAYANKKATDRTGVVLQKRDNYEASKDKNDNLRSNGQDDDESLVDDLAMDSFLRGEYDRPFAEDAPAPHPGLSPRATIEAVLHSLRHLNQPEPSHGAAVLQRFCAPLSRGERWGGGSSQSDPWKEVLRGAITPAMLARRIRASVFSVLLDWSSIDVTDGYSLRKDLIGVPTVAFVNAALFFGEGFEPSIVQFTLRRLGGVWLIDSARVSKKELFMQSEDAN